MWRDELGIHMDLRQLEWKVYLSAMDHLDYNLARSSWIGDYNDRKHVPRHVHQQQRQQSHRLEKCATMTRSSTRPTNRRI